MHVINHWRAPGLALYWAHRLQSQSRPGATRDACDRAEELSSRPRPKPWAFTNRSSLPAIWRMCLDMARLDRRQPDYGSSGRRPWIWLRGREPPGKPAWPSWRPCVLAWAAWIELLESFKYSGWSTPRLIFPIIRKLSTAAASSFPMSSARHRRGGAQRYRRGLAVR